MLERQITLLLVSELLLRLCPEVKYELLIELCFPHPLTLSGLVRVLEHRRIYVVGE